MGLLKKLLHVGKNYLHLAKNYAEVVNKFELAYDRSLGRFPRRLRVKLEGALLEFSSPGRIPLLFIYEEIYKNSCYVSSDWQIQDCFGPGRTVLDIGANVGLFSIFAAVHGAKVYSVEPNPCNFSYLLENIEKNELANIIPHNIATSGEDGTQELFIAEQYSGSSLINLNGSKSHFSVMVEAKTLKSILREIGDPVIDFLKIDCEGCEYDILLSSEPASLERVKRISLEFHRNASQLSPEALRDHLSRCGFHTVIEESPGLLFGYIRGAR